MVEPAGLQQVGGIETAMADLGLELGGAVTVTTMGRGDWDQYCDAMGEHGIARVRGWTDLDHVTGRIDCCPAVVATVAAGAGDARAYVEAVLQCLRLQVRCAEAVRDPFERRVAVEGALARLAPERLTLMDRVHLTALDARSPASTVAGSDAWAREAFGPQVDAWT